MPDIVTTLPTSDSQTIWPTKSNWVDLIMPDFYQQGLAILPQAIPADLCQALLTEVQQNTTLTAAGVGRAGQLQQQMNRQCFLGLTHHECHFARYSRGDFYQTHLDAFRGRSNRVLTTVLYLNDVKSGGELVIYDENEVELTRVLPQAGLLVTFESERFPHQVLPAEFERFSIAGWFRKD
jgi:SM-20-related protein